MSQTLVPIPENFKKNAYITSELYDAMVGESLKAPDLFWAEQAVEFAWRKTWHTVKDVNFNLQTAPISIKWFDGGKLNITENCIDRHLPTHANRTAFVWEGDNPNDSKHVTYQQLSDDVCKLANALKNRGVKKGDRITIYLPMIVEAAIAMLACARIGAVHSVVFGGFSAEALKGRIEDCGSTVIITADEGMRGGKVIPLKANVDAAIIGMADIGSVIVVKRTGGAVAWNDAHDVWYHEVTQNVAADCSPEIMDAEDPLFILYTSGSTGKPKGVLHTIGGYMVWVGLTFKCTFDYNPSTRRGEVGRGASNAHTYPHINIRNFARDLRKEMTDAEQKLWGLLCGKQLGVKFRKQHPIGPYIADFACVEQKLIIELDGSQHAEEKAVKKDIERTTFLQSQGFEVLRFWNNELFENIEGVVQSILNKIQENRKCPHPNPPLIGEGTDIFWCSADVGWVTGHSYCVYGPLLNAATSLLYEGVPNYPDWSRFWQVIDKHQVSIFYTAPTAIRAIAREGDEYVLKTSRKSLRLIGSVGEPINPEAWLWYYRVVGEERCPVIDTWWQTETGGQMMTTMPGAHAMKPGAAGFPFFGVQPVILDVQGMKLSGACEGLLCMADSWPGQARTVYGDHARFEQTYFSQYAGYYFTGDGAKRDADGYYWITGRVDDVLNVSGHRIGTAEVESALVGHANVAEAAVVGFPHDIKGQAIYCYVTLSAGISGSDAITKELKDWVRKEIGPFATPDVIHYTPQLPKTRSGKIMRRILRKIAEGDVSNLGDISTLTNPEIVEELINHRDKGKT